jgi:hypothetical protein
LCWPVVAEQELYFPRGSSLESTSLFEESRHRVRRAQCHRNAFADHWNALINDDALGLFVECKPDRTGIIGFRRQTPYVHDISFELGEFFYQLRAALDCLAFVAVRQITGDPIPNEDRIYFPIDNSPAGYQNHAQYIEKLPQQLLDWIKSIQPCFAPSSVDESVRQVSALLKLLHDCARKDRHRRLTVIAAWGSELSGSFLFTPHVKVEGIEGCGCNLFDNEGTIAKFRLAEYVPQLHVDLQGNLYVDTVMEGIGFKGPLFANALDGIAHAVDHAIYQFERAFAAT